MTDPTGCQCGHGMETHVYPGLAPQCSARGCTCLRYRSGTPLPTTKTCTGCGQVKPRDEFYARNANDPRSKRNPRCRDCENARNRPRTVSRVSRVRARHRAVAELIRRHDAEFRALLDEYTQEAAAEVERLAEVAAEQVTEHDHPAEQVTEHDHPAAPPAAPAVPAPPSTPEPPRLRPGPRRAGQTIEERLDVARCPQCVGYHDRGHRCEQCGTEPCAEAAS